MKKSKCVLKIAIPILSLLAIIGSWQGKSVNAGDATIDQQTYRRISHTGLVAIDNGKAAKGYVLFTPMNNTCGEVFLIDTDNGEVVHKWELPYAPGVYGYLLPNGNLFYNGQVENDGAWDLWPNWNSFKGGVMLEVDWDGNIVWELHSPYHHHDGRRTSSGGAIFLVVEKVSEEIRDQVQGGIESSSEKGDMWADVIVEVDKTGNQIWKWHAKDHLDFDTDVIQSNCPRDEWTHANTVVPLNDDEVMVSFRNISTVGIINKDTGDFVWKLGHSVFAQQHDPTLLDNGNILVFDNGQQREKEPVPYSRVIELNRDTKEIVWRYRDVPAINFFSPTISGAQRLSNGNTLVTEGCFGRIFQVTSEKEVVWEYVSPYFYGKKENEEDVEVIDNSIFKARFYTAEEIPNLR
ncbi:MAG: aryl sulfotransferase [Planctomycetes bacterium]|nr:aryl sulfotransferase [Planctomycetota bacterium]